MYQAKFHKKVQKFVQLHPSEWAKLIELAEKITQSPYPLLSNVKSMVWISNQFRIRIGDYRILYRVLESKEIIFYFDAKLRWDVYKNRK